MADAPDRLEMDPDALALLDAARHLADRVWRSHADPDVRAEVAAALRVLADRLGPFEAVAPVQTRYGAPLPGRGHPLLPPLVHSGRSDHVAGTVTFTEAHAGAGSAVHGGQVALLFDEVLGGVAGYAAKSRTASLHVNYRSLTPVGVALSFEAWVDRIDGRKVYVVGRLRDGDRLCADAEALFLRVDEWH
jgi:acyl-coenzyme A thioesterase PaaI-like protein